MVTDWIGLTGVQCLEDAASFWVMETGLEIITGKHKLQGYAKIMLKLQLNMNIAEPIQVVMLRS